MFYSYAWKGYGLFVIIIGIFWFFTLSLVMSLVYGVSQVKGHEDAILFTTSFFAAVTTWCVGKMLNRSFVTITKDGIKRTERRYAVNHSLYGIPFEYWSLVWVALSLWKAYKTYGHLIV
ncbi:MAG: hypothetical protein NTV80_00460 [Verrucomicrobia bacterium]|nr:hypothetical protein [Verrucomicrobiota bacterium]